MSSPDESDWHGLGAGSPGPELHEMIGVIRREVYGLINGSLDEPSVWNEGGEASLIENSVGEAKEKAPPVPGEVGLRAFNPEGDGGTRK